MGVPQEATLCAVRARRFRHHTARCDAARRARHLASTLTAQCERRVSIPSLVRASHIQPWNDNRAAYVTTPPCHVPLNRCTFEAMIVQLRQLPVSVAGYELDRLQRKLLSYGSLHVEWPWTGIFSHCDDEMQVRHTPHGMVSP